VESSKWYLVFLSGLFLGKWVGVGSMNGDFEDLSIGNKLQLNRARNGLEWLGASFTNTPYFLSDTE
jgi:hypothetical protein